MDIGLFRKALEKIDKHNLIKVDFSSSTNKFLKDYQIPEDVISFLKEFSFKENIKFKHVNFDIVNEMPENNQYKRCIDNGLFIIGSGLNGDLIVIDLNTRNIGYVFHDELWEDEDVNPREIYISLECSIPQFYYNSVMIDDYPVDGYEAETFMENQC
ncbi:SMI1/KNR4 family protein [Neobacillus citreus]|uniref:SMI1/KNR4 family protein n=1 Tax=Neobacillus citreus TaxID=2833578 RepID=A0A942YBY7_9BACI|nr:SMI1/KNR4 family protein [Neobacillus citreus]MCH6268887.1 hypothetical protein [Neobacillus citreus]